MKKQTIKVLLISLFFCFLIVSCAVNKAGNKPEPVAPNTEAVNYIKSAAQKLEQKNWQGVIEDANQAMSRDSSLGDPYLLRGVAECELGQRQQCIEDLRTAMTIYQRKNRTDRINATQKLLDKAEGKLEKSPSSVSEPSEASCPVNITDIMASLSNVPIDALRATSMLFPIEKGKQILTQIACDSSCFAEKERLSQQLSVYWEQYIVLSSQGENIGGCDSARYICTSYCNSDRPGCEENCNEKYQTCLSGTESNAQSKSAAKASFFSNLRGCLNRN